MAFSSFRMMMAAAGVVIIPPTDDDVWTAETATMAINDTNQFLGGQILPFTSTSYLATFSTGTNVFASVVSKNNSYVTNNTIVTVASSTSNAIPFGAQISTGNWFVTYTNGALLTYGVYLSATGSTVTAGTPALIKTALSGSSLYTPTCSISTSYSLVLIMNSSQNQIVIVQSVSTVPTVINTINGPSDLTNSSYVKFIAISSSLAIILYTNGSNTLQIATIDISGSSITLNASVSLGVTTAGGGSAVNINSSTAFITYAKSTNTIAGRTVSLASGGSVTVNTEYTSSVTNIASSSPLFNSASVSSTDYIVGWVDTTNTTRVISADISGNVVTWGISDYAVNTAYDSYVVTPNANPGELISLDSSHVAIRYNTTSDNIASGNYANYTTPIDLNDGNQLWGASLTGNIGGTSLNSGGANPASLAFLGTNRLLALTNNEYLTIDLTYSGAYYKSNTISGLQRGCLCGLGFSTTTRALILYQTTFGPSASNILAVISVSASGDATIGTTVSSGTGTAYYGTAFVMNLSTDTSISVYQKSDLNYYARVITTSGTTISSTGTEYQLTTAGNFASGTQFTWSVSSATTAILMYQDSNSPIGVYLQAISISGSTITVGALNNFTTYTQNGTGTTVGALSATNGIALVCDYVTGGASIKLYGFGYMVSGTTITVGTSNTLDTGNAYSFISTTTTLSQSVSNTQMLSIFNNSTNNPGAALLTYANINSISKGTNNIFSGNSYLYYQLAKTENNNALVMLAGSNSGTNSVFIAYRP